MSGEAAQCYGCDSWIEVEPEQKSHYYKQERHAAFRCYVCGRLFCAECAAEHFGLDNE